MKKLDDLDRALIARTCGDIGDSLHPYQNLARELNIPEAEVLERLRAYREGGLLRRFGAILRHQRAGFTANGMSVWNVPDAEVERIGAYLATFREISHCYTRPRLPDWPYNLYAMIHARTREECDALVAHIADETGIHEYQLLYSTREWKKTSMQYYRGTGILPVEEA